MTDVPRRLSARATTALRVFLTLLVVGMSVLWVYAFFLAPSGHARSSIRSGLPDGARKKA